jgi:hypothetical protein
MLSHGGFLFATQTQSALRNRKLLKFVLTHFANGGTDLIRYGAETAKIRKVEEVP